MVAEDADTLENLHKHFEHQGTVDWQNEIDMPKVARALHRCLPTCCASKFQNMQNQSSCNEEIQNAGTHELPNARLKYIMSYQHKKFI